MKQGNIIPQTDCCTRYIYECPRGTIAIDEHADGTREITRCLGGNAITRRDIRDAVRMHEDLLAATEEE